MQPIRRRTHRPSGHRELHEPIAETDKAVRFRYYAWFLWIPRTALVKVGPTYTAPAWAVDSAREHESAERFANETEAQEVAAELRGQGNLQTGSVFAAER